MHFLAEAIIEHTTSHYRRIKTAEGYCPSEYTFDIIYFAKLPAYTSIITYPGYSSTQVTIFNAFILHKQSKSEEKFSPKITKIRPKVSFIILGTEHDEYNQI